MNCKILNIWGKFRYKKVVMEPYSNLFLCTSIIFIVSIHMLDNFFLNLLSVGMYVIALEVIAQFYQKNIVRINDYLIAQKHPTRRNVYYIYQKVDYNQLRGYSCHDLRELYYSEMPQVLTSLRAGAYRIVTQPLFTKELLRAGNVQVICQKKAYKKKTGKLQEEIFLNRCRSCFKTNCPYRASKAEKQFYYVEFKILKGCVTIDDESYDDKDPRNCSS